MKALIISDIHANICGLEAIWEQEKDSDIIYCAGDLVDYGPFPKEVIEWVRTHHVICVQGNHDQKVVRYYHEPEKMHNVALEDRTWAHDNVEKLNDEDIAFLQQLPQAVQFEMDGIGYSMQHLFEKYDIIPNDHTFRLFWEQQTTSPIREMEQKRLIFGHTHRQGVYYTGNRTLWLNPGSASYRRKDDPEKTAQYMTITDGQIEMKSVAYDLTPLMEAALKAKVKPSEVEAAMRFFST